MFTALFQTIQEVTGRSLKFTRFEKDGTLQSIVMDADAAQAGGLGDFMLLQFNKPLESDNIISDPMIMVQYILKTCLTHYKR